MTDEATLTRFWAKVDKRGDDECWEWLAAKNPDGYGRFSFGGKLQSAHRVAYMLAKGPIPTEVLDHLCRNRACVNPAHLEAVSVRENTMRGAGSAANRARRTHCPKGHELAGDNLRPSEQKRGYRACRRCNRERLRVHNALISRAYTLVGMTRSSYVAKYGESRATAIAVVLREITHPIHKEEL